MTIVDQILSIKINGIEVLKSEEENELIEFADLEGNKIGIGWIMGKDELNDYSLLNDYIKTAQNLYLDQDFFVFFISKNEIKFSEIYSNILFIENQTIDSFLTTINKIIESKNKKYFDSYKKYKEENQLNQNEISKAKKLLQEYEQKIISINKEISGLKEKLAGLESNDIGIKFSNYEKIIDKIILDRLSTKQKETILKQIGHYKQINIEHNDSKIIFKYYSKRERKINQTSYNNDDGVPESAWDKVYGPNPWAQKKDYTYKEIDQDGSETILYNGETNGSSLDEKQKEDIFNLNYYKLKL